MEKISYCLIEDPFKKGKIAVTDRYSLSRLLERREKIEVKKTFHIPAEDRGKIYDLVAGEEVLKAENCLQKMYEEEAGESLGLAVFSFGTGIGLTYMFFRPLFDMGAYALPRYRIENAYNVPVEELSPEIVNNPQLVDAGARFFSKIAGITAGNLPFLTGLYYGVKHFREHRKCKRFSGKIEKLKSLELELIPDENLSSFQKESEGLINETRKYAQEFLSAESRKKKLRICARMQGELRRVSCLSKTYGLDGADSYYGDLEESLSKLKEILKKPRFWKNEKKYVKKLFGGEK